MSNDSAGIEVTVVLQQLIAIVPSVVVAVAFLVILYSLLRRDMAQKRSERRNRHDEREEP